MKKTKKTPAQIEKERIAHRYIDALAFARKNLLGTLRALHLAKAKLDSELDRRAIDAGLEPPALSDEADDVLHGYPHVASDTWIAYARDDDEEVASAYEVQANICDSLKQILQDDSGRSPALEKREADGRVCVVICGALLATMSK
jgi:hypothetical protein